MNNLNFDKVEYLKTPYKHCVIDNFLDKKNANILHDYIISLNLDNADHKFIRKNSKYEYNKFAFNKIDNFELPVKNIFKYLNSKEFIIKIEKLTGIKGLIYGDYNLQGAGIHIIKNKGFLSMHTDFNTYHHKTFGKLDRRINLLIYMNKDWNSNYKGDLIMYNPKNKSNIKRIEPIFNRCVIFNTTNKSIHGHPELLNVPKDNIYRKSIAVYYYTKNKNNETDFEGDKQHSTLWHDNPI